LVAARGAAGDQFIASFEGVGAGLRRTANPLHSQQEGHIIHGYYDSYGYLPRYMFCDQQLLCAYLRTSHIDGVQHAAAILRLLVRRLRTQWPDVRIVFRGDSGFCRQRPLNWCERAGGHFHRALGSQREVAGAGGVCRTVDEGQVRVHGTQTALGRRVRLCRAELATRAARGHHGLNGAERLHPRFIVTNLSGEPQALYDGLYCQRGEAENRIKEAQVGLFVTRTSCHVLRSKHAGRNGQPADCRENIRIKDLRMQNRT
jgi:hypothetical protein